MATVSMGTLAQLSAAQECMHYISMRRGVSQTTAVNIAGSLFAQVCAVLYSFSQSDYLQRPCRASAAGMW